MKYLILILLFVQALQVSAQEMMRKANVPPSVITEFENRFADASSEVWLQQANAYYGVRFELKKRPVEAIFTENGTWVQTVEEIDYFELPDSAKTYCQTNFPEYASKQCKKVSTRNYGIIYETRLAGNSKQFDLTFDMHGNLINEDEFIGTASENVAEEPQRGKLVNPFKKKPLN